MDELLNELLKQSPLVILMVVGYYLMLKEKLALKKEMISERKAHLKEKRELTDSYNIAIEKERDYIRDMAKENLETLEAFRVHFIKIKQ